MSQSARIYAEMARREGYDVLAVDAFADEDTVQAANEMWRLPALCGSLTSKDLNALFSRLDLWQPDKILIGSGFEADVENYERLCQRYSVLGNLPSVFRQVKNPQWLKTYFDKRGVVAPTVQLTPPPDGKWLYKVAGQCGGAHVREFTPPSKFDHAPEGYWQAFQAGQAVGALFVASQQSVTLIGVHALKRCADSYAYAGAQRLHDLSLFEAMQATLQAIVPDLALVGMNSIDAIWQDGQLHVLEINPRLSASMRLYADLPLIEVHIGSCESAITPVLALNNKYASHCILYARQPIAVAQLDFPEWLEDRPNEHNIGIGQPLCSMYAEGGAEDEVQQILQDRKTQLERLWGKDVCEHIEFNIH